MAGDEIVFRCPRCTSEVKVSKDLAGTKIYCLSCYQELTVPDQSSRSIQDAPPDELYAVDLVPTDVRDMKDRFDYHTILCPRCRSSIAVKTDQIGTTVQCPDCERRILVEKSLFEKRAANPFDRNIEKKEERPAEVYGVSPDKDYSKEEGLSIPPAADKKEARIPVYCPLCETLVYVRPDQKDKKIRCAECGREFIARPRTASSSPLGPSAVNYEGGSTYSLSGEIPVPKIDPNKDLVRVICRRCGTVMYAPQSMIGQTKKCPDCDYENPIVGKTEEERLLEQKIQPKVQEGYGVHAPNAETRPSPFPKRSILLHRNTDEDEDEDEEEITSAARKRGKKEVLPGITARREGDHVVLETEGPPRFAMINGVFRPLLDGELWRKLFLLFILDAIIFALVFLFLVPVFASGEVIGLGAIIIIPIIAGTCVPLVFTLWLFSGILISLFLSGSNGERKIEEWSDEGVGGGILLALWMIGTGFLALAPGMLVYLIPEINPLYGFTAACGSFIILFPFFFLCFMQTEGSSLVQNLFASFQTCFGVWISFMIMSLFLITPLFLFTILDYREQLFWIILYFCFHVLPLFYMILLGRLAWIITFRSRPKKKKKKEEQ
ncbi:MAG: hypothetical protein Q4G69_02595 [Planctomycetia bacterium]|nr:hypothetical protein [Planctomycetia bacterium]